MKVLLSWSGKQSNAIASFLRTWFAEVIPGCRPWMSSEDLVPGGRWFTDLMQQLQEAHFCIICLTPDNLRSNWLYFEAGAIAAKSPDSPVCGYLIGLSPSAVSGPLAQFQSADSSEDGTWGLVRAINQRIAPHPHDELLLKQNFQRHWPKLRKTIHSVLVNYDPTSIRPEQQVESNTPKYKMSKEAVVILLEASRDKDGMVLMAATMDGLMLQANNKQLCERGDPRSEARWKSAVRELVRLALMEAKGTKGEVFELTAEGFRIADELIAKPGTLNA